MPRARLPVTTITIFAITALTTTLQYFFPLLPLFERQPGALAAHEYWRLITPIFFHREGLRQIAFDLPALAIIGTFVERIFGGRRWLILYFAAGITGEIAGAAWKPLGAGSSVAICGLLGALGTWLLQNPRPMQSRFGGVVIVVGAVILTAVRDLHGPPLLVRIALGWAVLQRDTQCSAVPAGSSGTELP